MGWMNDILRFYEEDPIYQRYDFNLVTFSFMYAFSETSPAILRMMKWFMARRVSCTRCGVTGYNQFGNLLVWHP